MDKLRVLIACEFSGIVRDAFIARGHDAVSCDLLPTERPGPHIQGDVRDVLGGAWDLVVAHPPCDYLANCGVRWRVERGEYQQIADAADFFRLFIDCAPYWAIENPVMARKYSGLPPATFSRQPWQFGDNVKKRVCIWTNLPPLAPTSTLDGSTAEAKVHREPPSPERKKNRAPFFPGMAAAMADQWPQEIAHKGNARRALPGSSFVLPIRRSPLSRRTPTPGPSGRGAFSGAAE